MPPRGFTLVELAIVLALSGLLAVFAWPTMESRLTAARRADATVALERLQAAQERHRAAHGLYGHDARSLGVPTRSPEGLYEIRLEAGTGDTYLAVARPLPGSPQAGDGACPEITLQVVQGFAMPGPDRRCWSR